MKIATIVPRTHFGEGSEFINFQNFQSYLEQAKNLGADLVVFPESYPDNWQPPANLALLRNLKDLAKQNSVHLIANILEPASGKEKFYNTAVLINDLGDEVGRYRRTTPNLDPWLYKNGGKWEYHWERDNQLPIFETRFGKIGILICSDNSLAHRTTYLTQLTFVLATSASPASGAMRSHRNSHRTDRPALIDGVVLHWAAL